MTDTRSTDPDHLAFHPPLIRLQQQAPSPIGRRVLWCLLALLVFLIAWASVGRLDIVAVAEGQLVPQDHLKIVQPSEAGIVSDILVREGQRVQKDQVLMRMDALTTEADLTALTTERCANGSRCAAWTQNWTPDHWAPKPTTRHLWRKKPLPNSWRTRPR